MKKHIDNVQNLEGDAISAVTVTIRRSSDSSLASIFSDDLAIPTPLANPFTNDSDGEFFFFAPNDEYDILLSGAASETRANVTLFDPDDALIRGPILVGSTAGPTLLAIGQVIVADVSANAVVLTLPPDPGASVQNPDIVVQHLVGDISANNVTIQRNGELIGGVAADLVMSIPNESVRLIWAGSANGWAVQRIGASAPVGVTSGPGTYYKTADTARSSTIAPAIDTHLTTGAGGLDGTARYRFKAVLQFECASAVPNILLAVSGSAAATFGIHYMGNDEHSTPFGENTVGDASDIIGSSANFSMDGVNDFMITIEGFCSFSSGGAASRQLNIAWSQATSDATALILKEGSWFEVLKIADI